MIPYGQHTISDDDVQAVVEALRSDRITQGTLIDQFEERLSRYFECREAVVVNSGTMALHLVYKALGVQEGDKVITSPNTFAATANGVLYNDGQPVFLDINPNTFNLDVDLLDEFLSNTEDRDDIAGVVPVHFAGLPCEMERVYQLAERHNLFVLEDACHAPGARWRDSDGNWNKVGSCNFSDAAILSFHPVKHFTTGEGGAVLTNNEELAGKIRNLRHHGIENEPERMEEHHGPWYYEMQDLGCNGRITDFQCALGIEQLKRLDDRLDKRQSIARNYVNEFQRLDSITTQQIPDGTDHAYHLFVIRTSRRDQLFQFLREHDIAPQVHYIPVPDHPYYKKQVDDGGTDIPLCYEYYEEALSLPMYPNLTDDEQQYVMETIFEFFKR